MAIQPENKIFPHVAPASPDSEDDLLAWSKHISFAFTELSRLLVDRHNSHTFQTHPHPKGWEVLKVPRPSFKSSLADTSRVIVPGSIAIPSRFVIGETLYEIYDNLQMDLDVAGPGGLRIGLTKAANTIYYLYAVVANNTVALLADTRTPDLGPLLYTQRQYLGAFPTVAAAAIVQFVSHRGRFVSSAQIDQVSSTVASLTTKTIISPATTKASLGQLIITGTAVNNAARVTGFDQNTVNNLSATVFLQVSGTQNNMFCELALDKPTTIYLDTQNSANAAIWRVHGWVENPEDYK